MATQSPSKPGTLTVVGLLWDPNCGGLYSTTYPAKASDVEAIRKAKPGIERVDAVRRVAGDFQQVHAFSLRAGRMRITWAADNEAGAVLAEVV